MSLINQMLKDLESRQQGAISGQTQPVSGLGAAPLRRRRLLLVGLVVVLLLSGLALSQYFPALTRLIPRTDTPSADTVVKQDPVTSQPPSVGSAPVVAEQPQAEAVLPLSKTVSLGAMRQSEFDSFVHFEADFDRPPVYHLALAKDRRSLRVDLVAVKSTAELPGVAGQRWLQDLQVTQRDSGVAITLLAKPQVTIRDFSATVQVAGAGYRLLLDLYPELPVQDENRQSESPQVAERGEDAAEDEAAPVAANAELQKKASAERNSAAPSSGESLVRTERQPSAAELAGQAYRQGRAALAEGHSREGEAALRQALELQPANLAARQILVGELVRQQRPDEAGRLLSEGVELHPDELPLRMRYADFLVAQGDSDAALDLLVNGPQPSPAEAPRLHALQAALFQRLGRYLEAAREYEALLATQPDNALWLMGLGIAREYAGASEEAVAAYRAALAGQGLSPALSNYVEQRLAALWSK